MRIHADEQIERHLARQVVSVCKADWGDLSTAGQGLCSLTLPAEPRPRSNRTRAITRRSLYRRIRDGYGLGHGAAYLAWLSLTRKNPSPESNQVVAFLPQLQRAAHYFSRGEYHTALLLLWLAVQDLREQYPLWPFDFPHPLEGAIGADGIDRPWCRGLLQIAAAAGIDHGHVVGQRDMPYVATIDLLATANIDGRLMLAGFSSKPIGEANDDVKWRMLERLELERRYLEAIGARYRVTASALIPVLMAGQLEWWLDCATLQFAPHLALQAEKFSELVTDRPDLSLVDAVANACAKSKLSPESGWLLFRHGAWTQMIDIDPSLPIITSEPIRRGGRALRSAIRVQLFGADW